VLLVAESRKTFREVRGPWPRTRNPGPWPRTKKRPPAAAPEVSSLVWKGDDPEAFGSAAQPTPPGPYVANL
jgi:hypothetical protein